MELRNKVVLVVGVSTVSGQKLDVTLADFGVCAATYRSTLKVLERGLRGLDLEDWHVDVVEWRRGGCTRH